MDNRRTRSHVITPEDHVHAVSDAGELVQSQRLALSRAIRDEDSFTIFYELAYSEAPVSSEALSKTFGADLGYVSSVLTRLQRLGIAAKRTRGGRWQVREWAGQALKSLESLFENYQFDVQETHSTQTEISLGGFASGSADAATYNGLWVAAGSVSQATHLGGKSGKNTETGTLGNEAAKFGPVQPDRGQNETRSHDYK